MQLDFWHTTARPCLEPCKNHLSGPISSQMEHCEHSRWSCQRNNGSPRINFSVEKKASLCNHRIMAFICNLDLGWLLSNAFSLCYHRKGKNPCSSQGTSQDQMVPVGTHRTSPEPFWRKPEKKEKVSKILPGER